MADPVSLPTNFLRLGKFPIDSTLVVSNFNELTSYATNNPTAYTGQVVSVTALDAVYIIRGDRTVLPLQNGSLSANWQQTFNLVNANSGKWESSYTTWNGLSSELLDAGTFLNKNSSTFIQVRTEVLSQSSNWRSNYSSFNINSANYQNVYSNVKNFSADWQSVYAYVNQSSSSEQDQNESVTFVLNNSSTLIQVRTEVLEQSANNRSVYSTFNLNSADYKSVYSTWNSASGSIPTNNFVTTNFIPKSSVDIVLSVNSTNVIQNSAVATRIIAIENSLNVLAPAPTYTQPTVSLTNFSPVNFEVGSTVSRTLNVSYTQNDGGAATRFLIVKGTLASPLSTLYAGTVAGGGGVTEIASLGTTTYTASVSHLSGDVKLNVLGLPDSRGIITSGIKTTTRSYNGYYREFFGSVTGIPIDLRSLTGTRLTVDGTLYQLYAYQLTNVFAIPTNRNLVSIIVQSSNEDITQNFVNNLSALEINDAAGVARSYKRYHYSSALPFNSRLNITIN